MLYDYGKCLKCGKDFRYNEVDDETCPVCGGYVEDYWNLRESGDEDLSRFERLDLAYEIAAGK